MNTLDLLSSLPPFRDWTPAEILASPAWAMPCRLGTAEGRLVSEGALLPADPLRLDVRFADDPATLCLADSPLFPELHALWSSRADVPAPIFLALIEKECGPLLQLLENAAGRQLAIDGLANAEAESSGDTPNQLVPFSLLRSSGEALCSFALTLPPSLKNSFGQLRNLDPAHPSLRDQEYPAVVQLAEPTVSVSDLDSLAPGDHLLLPEVEAGTPGDSEGTSGHLSCPNVTLLVDNRLAASSSGLVPWSDSGTLRVVLADPSTVTFGALADLASGSENTSSLFPLVSHLKAGSALSLLRGPATLASGSLSTVAGQYSFAVESVLTP